ncbi:uncharacterized protein TNCV_3232761 [Trichonephila clavipes]|nr:uncharacterized protein TNCV_3232761 [Trichonephila clavipes]
MHYQVPRLRLIAVTLWCSDVAMDVFRKLYHLPLRSMQEKAWLKVENKVIIKGSNIKKECTLKGNVYHKLVDAVKMVGLFIRNMKEYIYEGLYIPKNYPKILCWTPHGTIDTGKSIKIVLKDDRFSIIRRYKLACVYCLEDDIRELLSKMSPACRKLFYDTNSKVLQNDLAVYWTYYIDGKIDFFEHRIQGSVNKYGLELAFIQGSKPAALYFFQKLNDEERYGNI